MRTNLGASSLRTKYHLEDAMQAPNREIIQYSYIAVNLGTAPMMGIERYDALVTSMSSVCAAGTQCT